MKFFNILIAYLVLISIFSSCSKPDNDFSLLEPAFKRCHLSKVFVNNAPWIEVFYKQDANFEIDKVVYYQNKVIRPDWTETYTYDNGKIASRQDQYTTYTYEYVNNNISKITECDNANGKCCISTFEFIGTFPIKVTTLCDGNNASAEIFNYTNFNNRSYYYELTDKNGTSQYSYQKFPQKIINPLYEIYPTDFDIYQDWIVENYRDKLFTQNTINTQQLINGQYPKIIIESIKTLPDLKPKVENIYNYEYVGCE